MKLTTIKSGSKGNCYLLQSGNQTLIIEAGVSFFYVKKQLDFNVKNIVGVIVSHTHKDHAGHIKEYEHSGIPIFQPYLNEQDIQTRKYGEFTIQTFPLQHDVPCFGFLIFHKDFGKLLYASDTNYIKYRFKDINHLLIECNHDTDLINENAANFEHSISGHMSLETCTGFIKANNDSLQNIVLCHMSDCNINEQKAIEVVKNSVKPNVNVYSAHSTKEIELKITPF